MGRVFVVISPVLFILTFTVVGFVSPGYNHLSHTISRLAIEQYGWIQSVNFLQLAVAMYISGLYLAKRTDPAFTRIRTIYSACAGFLILAAVFHADPIENVPLRQAALSTNGLMHILVVGVFLFLSPVGIRVITRAFSRDPQLTPYAKITAYTGYSVLAVSIVWFVFFFLGWFLAYRGLFEKIISLPVLTWVTIINYVTLFRPIRFTSC